MKVLGKIMIGLTLFLTGCMAGQLKADLSRQIDVFGVELHSSTNYKEIRGVIATEEPCLRGYERNFDQLDIIIGYGFDNKIRKIFTRNPATRIFGISPGTTVEEGKRLALKTGFSEIAVHKYRLDDLSLTFLVNDKNRIFGITIESLK